MRVPSRKVEELKKDIALTIRKFVKFCMNKYSFHHSPEKGGLCVFEPADFSILLPFTGFRVRKVTTPPEENPLQAKTDQTFYINLSTIKCDKQIENYENLLMAQAKQQILQQICIGLYEQTGSVFCDGSEIVRIPADYDRIYNKYKSKV